MGFFSDMAKSIEKKANRINETYEEGLYLDEETLFKRYRSSSGEKKRIYARVIKDRFSQEELNKFHCQGLI